MDLEVHNAAELLDLALNTPAAFICVLVDIVFQHRGRVMTVRLQLQRP